MPLCFLRGLCYSPTKTLSELFLTMSPSLCVAHALSPSLSPMLSLSFLLLCSGKRVTVYYQFYNVAWVTMKSFYSPVPQMHIKKAVHRHTLCDHTAHSHTHTNAHIKHAHALHTPANFSTPWALDLSHFLRFELCHLFKYSNCRASGEP